ncbi:MAG TPA: S9 family peptidase, partial [Chitinophagaceae bacterium]|nr:S9 family peptidase [Chitinophagaceae bacterium]
MEFSLTDRSRNVLVKPQNLTPSGKKQALGIKNFFFSADYKKILIYTNAKKVWRYETRGDYWVYNISDSSLRQLGKSLPPSSLMFAKFSPDGRKVAYVSRYN